MNKGSIFVILYLVVFSSWLQAFDRPGQSLEDLDGIYHPMSNYLGQGKWAVVNIWSPTCSACIKELPKVSALHAHYSESINVLGITVDYPSFNYGNRNITKKFLKKNPLYYPIFLADHSIASQLIGNYLIGIPLVALFHPDGRTVARWPGPIHSDEILEFIENYEDHFMEDPFIKNE